MSMPKSVKLYYFDLEGRAEVPRWLLRYAGIPFEDIKFEYLTEWPQRKTEFPFHSLPVLEVDGVKIPQSHGILLYAASLAGLCPTDPMELAKVNAVIGAVDDFYRPFSAWYKAAEESEKKKLEADIMANTIPTHLKRIDAYFAKHQNNGFLTGRFSVGDAFLFYVVNSMRTGELKSFGAAMKKWESDFPALFNLDKLVRKQEGFMKHVKECYRA